MQPQSTTQVATQRTPLDAIGSINSYTIDGLKMGVHEGWIEDDEAKAFFRELVVFSTNWLQNRNQDWQNKGQTNASQGSTNTPRA